MEERGDVSQDDEEGREDEGEDEWKKMWSVNWGIPESFALRADRLHQPIDSGRTVVSLRGYKARETCKQGGIINHKGRKKKTLSIQTIPSFFLSGDWIWRAKTKQEPKTHTLITEVKYFPPMFNGWQENKVLERIIRWTEILQALRLRWGAKTEAYIQIDGLKSLSEKDWWTFHTNWDWTPTQMLTHEKLIHLCNGYSKCQTWANEWHKMPTHEHSLQIFIKNQ